jgi:hypothetical protein
MAYGDFTLEAIVEQQQLHLRSNVILFGDIDPIAPSSWLQETLSLSERWGIPAGSEKARSEFIVAPVLLEVERRNRGKFVVFSGKLLDIDKEKGLNGECDFILSKGEETRILQVPIFSIVEAKRQDIEIGLGQCVAQLIGASMFNQRKGNQIPILYGCVTTADRWQFFSLNQQELSIDRQIYTYPDHLDTILGIFQFILDQALDT